MSSFIAEKAARLLAEGRVRVERVSGDRAVAIVEGDSGTYSVQCAGGSWTCECPAPRDCSHVMAVRLVTVPRAAPQPTRRQLADARAAELRVGMRGDDRPPPRPLPLPLLTVGTPPRLVVDTCPLCDEYAPVTTAGTCEACALVGART